MWRGVIGLCARSLLAAGVVLLWATSSPAQQSGSPEFLTLVGHDVSPPLRQIVPVQPEPGQRELPLRAIPQKGPSQPDGAQQAQVLPLVSAGGGWPR
jgi:hypothetical protein